MNIAPELIEDAKRILTWLCFSMRQVTVNEIIEGLMVQLGESPRLDPERRLQHPDDVIRICPRLISISTGERDAWTLSDEESLDSDEASLYLNPVSPTPFAHFSVLVYLESVRIRSQTAAKICSGQLHGKYEASQNMLHLLQKVHLTILGKFPLASYAAEFGTSICGS